MKMNLLRSAFILTILPVTSLFSSQQPLASAAASGAVSPQPGAAAVVEAQPGIFDDLIAAADASAAQKQAAPAQPAGMPDLLAGDPNHNPESAALLASAAAAIANLSIKSAAAQAEGAPANGQPVELDNLNKQKKTTQDTEGQQAALDSLTDKKQKAEGSTGITSTVAGVVSGAYEIVRSGVKLVKDSPGRKLLDRLALCEKEKREFAGASAAQDISLIALGVEDSITKLKTENLEQMIAGLKATNAKVDEQSRRALRRYMTEERDTEIETVNALFNEKVSELLAWLDERRKPLYKKSDFRKTTFQFAGCVSDDEDELQAISTETLRQRLYVNDGRKIKVVKVVKKSDKSEKPSGGDKKLEKPAASAAAKQTPSPSAAAGKVDA